MSIDTSPNLMTESASTQPPEDAATLEIKQKMLSNFSVFDHENTKTVDVSEVRAIVASLELYPTQTELHDLITEMEEEEPTGYIRYDRFEPVVFKAVAEKRYSPASEEILLKAFETLDRDNRGYLTPEDIEAYFTEGEDSFSKEELDEFLHSAIDPNTGNINYRDFVQSMLEQDSN
ncbi:hypothetical protein LOD99_2539 [Oopsacas minuta]|uniref:EF-hand domain-containing protein n=1 Tax=Oopsacas minuta TaxID=111878 RepID=A0AAV7K283_9METZ|nr:hypothetical protein LOD99_2539 [Oopsacas minuta]